jgi:peroxiredoxin
MAIEIGQPAPDFELKDPAGETVTLSGFAARRAGDVSTLHLHRACARASVPHPRRLQPVRGRRGAGAAVSCDSRHAQRIWSEQQGYQFPVLSDFWPHGEVAKAYGVFNEGPRVRQPRSFLIGASGVLVDTFASADLGTPRGRALRRGAAKL